MAEEDECSLPTASPQKKESLWKRSKKILDANQTTFLQPLLKNSEGKGISIRCHHLLSCAGWFRRSWPILFALFLPVS